MANLLYYNNVQVVNSNTVVTTIPKVSVPVSTKATAAYNKYKNYNQSNIFQVGSWTTGGTAGTTVMTFNDNWNTVCSDFGVSPRSLTMLLVSTTTYPPSAAQKADFVDNMGFYFPKIVNCVDNALTGLKYNNASYNLYCMFNGTVSNFRREGHIPIYDPVENHWYQFGFEYRTDNFNPGKVWLVVSNPQVQNTFFPTSGIPIVNTANPYPNIEDSDTGGGEGDAGGTSDTIPVPSLPTISALGSGLIQLYNPSSSQLAAFGRWLWAGSGAGLDLEDLKKVFNDPMDMILGLSIFPVAIPSSGDDYIKMGNVSSTVSAPVASAQYAYRDMGTLDINRYYNSYLDYAPYTKVQIFLPYIGIKQLNTDEVMGKTLGLKYAIDLLSGACVAHITVNGSLMYEFGGTCNAQVPLTGRDMTSVLQSLVGAVAGGAMIIGGLAAGAGAGAGAVAGATATGAVNASAIGAGLIGSARSVLGMKPTVEHASGIGGTTGYMSSQTPFLIIERPRLCHPENQEHFTGYPGFIYRRVGDCEGFTKFVNVELTRIHATKEELEELENWFVNRGVRL